MNPRYRRQPPAFQAGRRGFESRPPLQVFDGLAPRRVGCTSDSQAERRGFESRFPLQNTYTLRKAGHFAQPLSFQANDHLLSRQRLRARVWLLRKEERSSPGWQTNCWHLRSTGPRRSSPRVRVGGRLTCVDTDEILGPHKVKIFPTATSLPSTGVFPLWPVDP